MSDAKAVDPEAALARLRSADVRWAAAVRACGGVTTRLREFSEAARDEATALRSVDEAGVKWSPRPGARGMQLPYELRPGSVDRDPSEPWEALDDAWAGLGRALEGDSMYLVSHSFDSVAIAAHAIVQGREARSEDATEPGRQRAAGD
jgi:hypothetical protein